MAPSLRSTAAVALGLAAFTISGCGDSQVSTTPAPSPPSSSPPSPPSPSPSSSTSSTPQPSTTTKVTTTTTTGLAAETSIWAWRKDLDHGVEITYDLSGDLQGSSFYGGCWKDGNVDTVGESDTGIEDGIKFVEMSGETGLTLFNKRAKDSSQPGCLMRKSRTQIDLSVIGKMELDLKATGQGTLPGRAPWYSVWLAPMQYADDGQGHRPNEQSAEIDLIENYAYADEKSRTDMNNIKTNFGGCGDEAFPYTHEYCKSAYWSQGATEIDHHITVKARDDPADGRVIEVRRCAASLETCPEGDDFTHIKVQKPNPNVAGWFPIWNKGIAGDNYAKYTLVADMWFTSNTDFALSVSNMKFFLDDGTEWKMPLDYSDAEATFQKAEPPAFVTVV